MIHSLALVFLVHSVFSARKVDIFGDYSKMNLRSTLRNH
jgi:hypothetical protein